MNPSESTALLRNGAIHNPAEPSATAMLVAGGTIAWIGSESAADAHAGSVSEVIDLRGALVTPAFVDAHVHTTATGLALTGLDLSGCATRAEALDRIAAHAAALPADAVVLGSGWDESAWSEPAAPTRAELDRAVAGRRAYLSRVDVHSALASSALLDAVPQIRAAPGYAEDRPLARDAHHAARAAALGSLSPGQRADAQRATLRHAAALGIGALHECGGPQIAGQDDFTGLLALAAAGGGPYVFGYWGELTDPVKARELGAVGAGGDLFIDGAIGSRTASLRAPYADAAEIGRPDHPGNAYLTAQQVGGFVVSCVEADVQPGFHVIGDYALDLLVSGLDLARDVVGERRLRAARVRAEHAEMPDGGHLAKLAHYGVLVCAQPGFDAAWGGPAGMYARRLGAARAQAMNPFAAMAAAGIGLAFGSDSPVVALGPWAAVRAAAFHQTPASRLTPQAAFAAHTRGGWRALRPGTPGVPADETGVLAPGAPATYAVWRATGPLDQGSDEAPLPDLAPGSELPECLRTAVRGQVVHDRLEG